MHSLAHGNPSLQEARLPWRTSNFVPLVYTLNMSSSVAKNSPPTADADLLALRKAPLLRLQDGAQSMGLNAHGWNRVPGVTPAVSTGLGRQTMSQF